MQPNQSNQSSLFNSIKSLQKGSKYTPKVVSTLSNSNSGSVSGVVAPILEESKFQEVPTIKNFNLFSNHIPKKTIQELDIDQNMTILGSDHNSVKHSGAVVSQQSLQEKKEQQIHTIKIKNHKFDPAYLKIRKGSIVEWKICSDSLEENESSLYHNSKRSHVIYFQKVAVESSPLSQENETFKVRFLETGVFHYGCSIYTRMKGSIEIVDIEEDSWKNRTIVVKQVQDINKIFKKATVPLVKQNWQDESCLFKPQDESVKLNQKLIEVLETEENLSEHAQYDTDTPAIQKSYFKEVFDNYNHLLKCEAELDDEPDPVIHNTEQIEAAEREEKIFMEQQWSSSKTNSHSINSQKSSTKNSQKQQTSSSNSEQNNAESQDNSFKEEEKVEEKKEMTAFSMLYHSEQNEKRYLQMESQLNMIEINLRPETDSAPLSRAFEEEQKKHIGQQKKAIAKIYTLEPDKQGGNKQVSKEFYVYQDNVLIDEETAQYKEMEKMMQNQKKKNKKKLYQQKKNQKLRSLAQTTTFDLQIIEKMKNIQTSQVEKIIEQSHFDQFQLTDNLNFLQKRFDQIIKKCRRL